MIVQEAVACGGNNLKLNGIQTPQLDASILLAHVLKTNRTLLFAAGNEPISDVDAKTYFELIERRIKGECVAYLTGKKEFWGLEFTVNKSVLVPRPETEILVETALGILKEVNKKREDGKINEEPGTNSLNVIDLCTGSGVIAVSIKHEMPQVDIYAVDICNEAVETAKDNASVLLPGNNIHFCLGDLYDVFSGSQLPVFSLIVSNPPYVPSGEIKTLSLEVQNEPRLALDGGDDGLDIVRSIINGAPRFLTHGGVLLLEADPRQMDCISGLLENRGFKDIMIYKDLSGFNRVIKGVYGQ